MKRLFILIIAIAFLTLTTTASAVSFGGVKVHEHPTVTCNEAAWSFVACADVANDVNVITGPGTIGSAGFQYRASVGWTRCADLYDVALTIPARSEATTVQAGGAFFTDCAEGSFFYELDQPDLAPTHPLLAGIRIGTPKGSSVSQCIEQRFVWCERTSQTQDGRDSTATFRLTTRPLLIHLVNSTPNPLERIPYGQTHRGLAMSAVGDSMYDAIQPSGSAWMGGLRRTGADSCPDDATTGKPEADCVANELGHSVVGAVLRFLPNPGAPTDYAGAELVFKIRVRTDGVRASTCQPLYRPTLPPLTCTVEFSGANDGITTATVTVKTSGA